MLLLNMYKKSPEITTSFFILTKQCNLRCKYCYEKHTPERMSVNVAVDGVDFLFRNAKRCNDNVNITFFGGEPTLEKDLIDIIVKKSIELSKYNNIPVYFSMITNCTQLPNEIIDTMVYSKNETGSGFSVQLSIDGPENIQNAYRVLPNGGGSWKYVDPVIDIWKDLDKNGTVHISAHSCINKDTVGKIVDIYKYFRYDRGLEKIWLMAVPEVEWTEEDVSIYSQQNDELYDIITEKCMHDRSFNEIHFYAPFDKSLNTGVRGIPCGAGTNFATIMPNGSLAACHQLGLYKDMQPIGDIWYGIDDNRRRIFTEYSDEDMGCGDCEHQSCYRCIASNFSSRGVLFTKSPDLYCKLMLVDWNIQKRLKKFMRDNNEFNKKVR